MASFRFSSALVIGAVLVLSACAPQTEPVTITPTYDKFGAPSCPFGTVLVPATDTSAEFCQPTET